eukprot:SAG31_NODE_1309_length_8877_cov_5.662452_3_plen_70_part_00
MPGAVETISLENGLELMGHHQYLEAASVPHSDSVPLISDYLAVRGQTSAGPQIKTSAGQDELSTCTVGF